MKILVAGIGNIFLGDDAFGPSVIAAARAHAWPAGVTLAELGIRGMDLAFALTAGPDSPDAFDAAILVDAVARGGAPGTLYAIDATADTLGPASVADAHGMDPARVLAFAATLGPLPPVIRVIGCEPQSLGGGEHDDDLAAGLSAPVSAAIAPAIEMIRALVTELGGDACTS